MRFKIFNKRKQKMLIPEIDSTIKILSNTVETLKLEVVDFKKNLPKELQLVEMPENMSTTEEAQYKLANIKLVEIYEKGWEQCKRDMINKIKTDIDILEGIKVTLKKYNI